MKKVILTGVSLFSAVLVFASLSFTGFALEGSSESIPPSSSDAVSEAASATQEDASQLDTSVLPSAEETQEELPSSIIDAPAEEEQQGTAAIAAASAALDQIIDVASYLTPAAADGRKTLDLALLKADGLLEGTLLIQGTSANKTFVKIIDTSATETGNYNILLGNYGGVEIPEAAGVLNTFGSITNQPGITNMLPVYTAVSMDSISIDNGGSTITLLPIIEFDTPNSYGVPSYGTCKRNLGIAVVGANTRINTVSLTDISVLNYIQGNQNTYSSASFMGPQQGASIENFIIGNVSISLKDVQLGVLIGASLGNIKHFEINGTVNITGLSFSSGLPDTTYSAYSIIGVMGAQSQVDELVITSTAKITVKDYAGNQYGVSEIGLQSYNSNISQGRFIVQPGSEINFINYRGFSSTNVIIGGEARVMDFGGKIQMSSVGSVNTFIGKGYNAVIVCDMLLIRSTADINISSKKYVSVAIGYGANTGSPSGSAPKAMENMIIEKGAKIALSIDTVYGIKAYYDVDVALGGSYYSSPNNFLIGATYNAAKGAYEVVPSADTASQTTINLKNYRMLVYTQGSSPLPTLNRKAQLNANVYAEYNSNTNEFLGGNGNAILVGGNYLAKDVQSGSISYISFNEQRTGGYNSMQGAAYNQYFEPLSQKLYQDDTNSAVFTYNVPWQGFDATKPEYNYYMVQSFNSSIPAQYKALYYPTRILNLRMSAPAQNGEIAANGVVALEFDHPVFAADNIDKGLVITFTQNSVPYVVNLSTADKDKYTFGSDISGGNPQMLYIDLSKVTNASGQSLAPGQNTSVKVSSGFSKFFYTDDAQLTTQRISTELQAGFLVKEAVYTVRFDLNGGTSAAINAQNIVSGNPAVKPADPTWDEHTFMGWNVVQASQYTPWNFNDNVYADLNLVALWKTNTYQVTYNGNGYTGGSLPVDAGQYAKGAAVVVSNASITKSGFVFKGWKFSTNDTVLARGAGFTMPNANVTLVAQWEAESPTSNTPPSTSVMPPSTSVVPPSTSVAPSSSSTAPASSSTPASSSASGSGITPASSSVSPASSTPASSVQPASTSTEEQRREEVREEIIESGVPVVQLGNTQVPLFGGNATFVWSLLSLIFMVISSVFSVFLAVKMLVYKRIGKNIELKSFKFVSIALGIISLISFFVLYNLNSVMVFIDGKTIIFAVLLLADAVAYVVAKNINRKHTKYEN